MKVETRQGISVYAFAKTIGVSKTAVQKAVENGRIPRSAVFDDGSLDEAAARVAFYAGAQIQRHKPPTTKPRLVQHSDAAEADEPGGLAAEVFRVKFDTMKVELATKEHQFRTLEQSTIDKDKARRTVIAWNLKIKNGLLNFASRRGPALAAALGVDEVALVGGIEAAMREHLAEMADEPLPIVGADE